MDPRPCAISLSGVEAVCLLQVLAHPAPRRDARATPYGFSRMQRVTVVDDADVLCLHAQRTCLNNQQDIDACACIEAVREIDDIVQRNSQGFSTAADRMAAVTVVPDILLIPSVYTTS